jgi:hypothetical protein
MNSIAWLAGLLEGEGTFFTTTNGYSPRVALAMTDRDVVEKAALLMGGVKVYPRKSNNTKHKDQWWCMVTGARAAGVMMTIYSLMGNRRNSKILQVLERWKSKAPKRQQKNSAIVNCGHKTLVHYAKGYCRNCYTTMKRNGEHYVHRERVSITAGQGG